MTAIFRDDSTTADKRAAAVVRLLALCPAALRMVARPMIEQAVAHAPDRDIDALMFDVDRVIACAEAGDADTAVEIARRYGATDEHVARFRQAILPAARDVSAQEQFGDFLPKAS